MSEAKWDAGRSLRFIVSRGWADEDAEVVGELLRQARDLAVLISTDDKTSVEFRAIAENFLDRLHSETATYGTADS